MAMNDIAMLTLSEQDGYAHKKTSATKHDEESAAGFGTQLDVAHQSSTEKQPHVKAAGSTEKNSDDATTDENPVSGEAMLAQINAAHSIDVSVNSSDYKALPIAADFKKIFVKPEDKLAPIVIAPQAANFADSEGAAAGLANDTAHKQPLDAAVASLLTKDNAAIKSDTLLSRLTPEQHQQLNAQLDAMHKPSSNDNLASLRQMLAQFIIENEQTANPQAALKAQLDGLTTTEKQSLVTQLNGFVKNEQPQGERLANIKHALNDLTAALDSKQAGVQKDAIAANGSELLTPRSAELFSQLTGLSGSTAAADTSLAYQQASLDAQALQLGALHSSGQTKAANLDPTVLQALNIIKSDAAKMLQERVSSMLSINNKMAEIRLDPPEMGSMQIRIRSDAEQAQINFVVQNQQAKEALEQSLPRLREMLAQQGIDLGESTVSYGEQQGGEAEQNQPGAAGQLTQNDDATDENEQQTAAQQQSSRQQTLSTIDYYA
ncbi:flagellar hook-length control protein FliK [Pseudoalteromonas sp.]|uniref:flagellar hook-length control protein FliK n=1 Tax=Pseudoalteromonas sp. TaxID=53249 RepID=UPI003569E674